MMPDPCETLCHYPTSGARRADLVVHVIGLLLAALGGAVMLKILVGSEVERIVAVAIYAIGLIAMLSFSLAYNLGVERYRPFLRRLDHIGIFLMIAGTYTPFTTLVLSGDWAWGMTIAVWTIAGAGIVGKATKLRLPDSVWTGIYLALGWLMLLAIRPISGHISSAAIILLVVGGMVYTTGAVFYVTEISPFWRSIWHSHVLVAACAHWAAIFNCVVLPVFR